MEADVAILADGGQTIISIGLGSRHKSWQEISMHLRQHV